MSAVERSLERTFAYRLTGGLFPAQRRCTARNGEWNANPPDRQPKNHRAHAHAHECVFLRSLRSISTDLEIRAGHKAYGGGTQIGTQQERSVPGVRPPPADTRSPSPLLPPVAAVFGGHHRPGVTRMTIKPRLTSEQHADLGRTLAAIRDEITHRAVQLENAYPRTGPEALPARKLAAAARALDSARSALDSALFREHLDTAETTVYYPHPDSRASVVATLQPRGTRLAAVAGIVPCPNCAANSSYFRDLDRYVHYDGSDNQPCWLALSRGEAS